jgi:vacuolar-type H+-ATPase subunit H
MAPAGKRKTEEISKREKILKSGESERDEILIIHLKKVIRIVTQILAVLMTDVIIWDHPDNLTLP